ncbi:MAG: polyprenyl synthetase family protein [Calditrichaeota bacterium]|nr:polyprenyl synthetase family protein [Calditrichota bacterium]
MSEKQKIFFAELQPYLNRLQQHLAEFGNEERIPLFYDPIHYILKLPGKRIRPLLVILSALTCGGKLESALYPAAAVELLHNFTLVHDDIMDNDDLRRGQPTVHKKWDIGTAILAGDGLMGLAFKKLLECPEGDVLTMVRRFTEVMLIICEGQGMDKMFEMEADVSEEKYLEMIRRKTAVLIELSCELGAITAGTDQANIRLFRRFGHALGMGFQIQDDFLDIMADEQALGKKVGSDWMMHKQTILTIKLRQRTQGNINDLSFEEFRELLKDQRIVKEVEELYQAYFRDAFDALNTLPQNSYNRSLKELTSLIQNRRW